MTEGVKMDLIEAAKSGASGAGAWGKLDFHCKEPKTSDPITFTTKDSHLVSIRVYLPFVVINYVYITVCNFFSLLLFILSVYLILLEKMIINFFLLVTIYAPQTITGLYYRHLHIQ